jgi:serine/threonine-protein kinase
MDLSLTQADTHPLSALLHIDEVCRRFEAAWKDAAATGPRPAPEAYLGDTPEPARTQLLCELVRLEIHYRARAGDVPDAAEFRTRFPNLNSTWLSRVLEAAGAAITVFAGPRGGEPLAAGPGLKILEELGRGGMGAVFKVRDPQLGRDVAIKVLLPEHHNHPELYLRFVEEARIAGQLQHPGIVPVYALGETDPRRAYFTMKLVEGQTLAVLLTRRPSPAHELTRFLKVFEQVCQAVAYAHSRGVIHRDLKPANIMVGAFGEVQLMDWGLAKRTAAPADAGPAGTATDPALTGGGRALGTPAYMAPEQARGEAARLDERCDVFGLGALLCEILTGHPPYAGLGGAPVHEQARRAELTEAWARLDGCGADDDLVQLARSCLAAERDQRPRHAGVVAEAVTAYLAGVAERLRAAEIARATAEVERAAARAQAAAERKRRRVLLALAATVLGMLAVAAAGGLYLSRQHEQRQLEQAQRQTELRTAAQKALDRAGELHRQARWAEARALLEQACRQLGEDAPADLRAAVERALADMTLVGELDAIRLKTATWVEGKFDHAGADQGYAAAFRQRGLGDEGDDPARVAARVRSSAVKEHLLGALDDWAYAASAPGRRAWLMEVARRADPHPWRDRVRDPGVWQDSTRLAALAARAKVQELSPQTAVALAWKLGAGPGSNLLRRVQRRYPADFWVNFTLGTLLIDSEEGTGYLRAAVALRPGASAAHANLGAILQHVKRDYDGAIACFERALDLDPRLALAHSNLGVVWWEKRKPDKAIAHFRKALVLDPRLPRAQYSLGLALHVRGEQDEAIACFERAIRIDADFAEAHCNLGGALRAKGRFAASLRAYRRGHELGSRQRNWRYPESAQWVKEAEWYVALEQKLPDVLSGKAEPADDRERFGLSEVCRWQRRYAAATRLFTEALAGQPALVADGQAGHRYRAAVAAARAGCGEGDDAPPEGPERARLRLQALVWLRADLADFATLVGTGKPEGRRRVCEGLESWQRAPGLAGLRNAAALARLPGAERDAWRRLWADVAALLERASALG